VAVRLPPFWAERPTVWFAQAEAQFSWAGITSEKTIVLHVVSQLDHQYAAEVEDIIISPPESNTKEKWERKRMHGQFPRSPDDMLVGREQTYRWLKFRDIKGENN
jgi:hypothetical protein